MLKSGAWYLVGAVEGNTRTYRISRILHLTTLDTGFDRPATFQLAAYWSDSTQRLETELHQGLAVVRLSPVGFKMLDPFISPYARSRMTVSDADGDGFRTVTLPVGSAWHACSDILRFGTDAEVSGPPELRARMRETVAALHERYSAG